MTAQEILGSMSEEDKMNAWNVLHAAHEGNDGGVDNALEAMSKEGLRLFLTLLEMNAKKRGIA